MKNTILFIALLTISVANVFSQKNSLCLDVGFHGNLPDRLFNSSIPKSNPKNGGLGAQLMPIWNHSNHISYGINLEFTYLTTTAKYDVYHKLNILSVSPTFKYTFTDNAIRPFVGSGMGVYHVFNHTPVLNLGVKPFIGVSFNDVFNLSFEFTQILSKIKENPDRFIGFNEYFVAFNGSFSFGLKKTARAK